MTTPVSPLAELWLTLGRAFLPPQTPAAQAAFRNWLPGDLRDLAADAGIDAADDVDALAAALDGYGGTDKLLVHYSRLFLAPPAPLRLNVAACLQGTLNGTAMDLIDGLLDKYDIGRNECFHDTPDHLSSLLELMAVLETNEAASDDRRLLANAFLASAVRQLATDIAGVAPASPYRSLLAIVSLALAPQLAEDDATPAAKRRRPARDPSTGVWRECRQCGRPIAREKELAVMARALHGQGLGCEHLTLCPDCRNPLRATEAAVARA